MFVPKILHKFIQTFPFFCLQNCPTLLECKGENDSCIHKGVANIRARLQELNGRIRSGQDKVWLGNVLFKHTQMQQQQQQQQQK